MKIKKVDVSEFSRDINTLANEHTGYDTGQRYRNAVQRGFPNTRVKIKS